MPKISVPSGNQTWLAENPRTKWKFKCLNGNMIYK